MLVSALKTGVQAAKNAAPVAASSVGQVRGKATQRETKTRIEACHSVYKITKAMQSIANAKLNPAIARMQESRPMAASVRAFIDTACSEVQVPELEAGASCLVIPITSDKGLCGALNTKILFKTMNTIQDLKEKKMKIKVITVGEKGHKNFQSMNPKMLVHTASHFGKTDINFLQASRVAEFVTQTPFDQATILYNKYINRVSFTQMAHTIPALTFFSEQVSKFGEKFEFEGDEEQILKDLAEFQFAVQLYGALLENGASEQSSRLAAMDNASKNAASMALELTQLFNRTRQMQITAEMIEISTGAECCKAKKEE
eukprot:JP446395.1.p1 GENE.JP446395.1~~JP446395.1.p1  ORF type:complete len:315 (+),score=140.81 JP446395.1:32-976(+)